ncbi:hypothetical protein ACE1ET_01395 [Saccharicrinis sp. FJH62]|uniref:hypothetical protein n=1 Tax=Saccharicrinis sp. FJH62 TaxID=3344657 RepID=UPI0035D418FC
MEHRKENTKATIYTIISVVVMLLLLIFFGFKAIMPDSEEGILVDFGNSVVGTGLQEPAPSVEKPASKPKSPTVSEPVKAQPQTSEDVKEDVETQDFDEAPVIESGKRKQETEEEIARKAEELRKQKEAEEAERIRKAAEEAERKRLEEIERKKKEEAERLERERLERERKAAEIRQRTQNAFGGGAGNANTSGEGQTGDAGNQGSPNGAANTGTYSGTGLGTEGVGFELTGRSNVGSLPLPVYNIQEDGIVVVQIEVDRSGRVISATPILLGSTTQNAELWRVAKEAALKARFNDDPTAPIKQIGKIKYTFSLD